jgi:hypothetical protein
MEKEQNENEKYYCNICQTQFEARSYWKHINRKSACISPKKCLKVIDEKKFIESENNYLKKKAIIKDKELEFYKKLVENNKELSEKITLVENKIDEKIPNNTFVQNNNINNIFDIDNSKKVINIKFAEPYSERLDHINMDMMMSILDHSEYNNTLKELIAAVYFHPEAPQNWNWCITDIDSQNGALEYNHKTGNLDRNSSTAVINKNVQNIMYRVGDMLNELKQNREFNKPQTMNMNRLYNAIDTDLNPQQISTVKKVAYSGRNLPRALWQYLNIMVEKVPIVTPRINLQDISTLDQLLEIDIMK